MTDMSTVSADAFAAFVGSMPAAYRSAFDLEATKAHASIVERRGKKDVHVEIWKELSERVAAICIVAEDKPGLLSCISAAMVAHKIDVVTAHAFCRTCADGKVEAVDILWVRRLPDARGLVPPIRSRDIFNVTTAIERAIANGSADVEQDHDTSGVRRVVDQAPSARSSASVRFEPKDGATVLTVEAVDRPGLLLAVTQALFRANVQIVALRATTERGCAVDRFTLVEVDGTPLNQTRLLSLQIEILGALDQGTLAKTRTA